MLKRTISLFIILICCIFSFMGCGNKTNLVKTKDVDYKVLIDKMDNSNTVASIYYEKYTTHGVVTQTYYWKNKELIDSNDIYYPTYSNVYPSDSVDNLKKKLHLTKSPVYEYGQLFFYGNTLDYELFVFDCSRNGKDEWKVIFDRSNGIKELQIKKDLGEVTLDSYQIAEDAVYLYTRGRNEINSDFVVYKISLSNYDVIKYVIPFNVFKINEVAVGLDQVFIKDDVFLLSTSEFDFSNNKNERGVFLRYDLKAKTADTFFINTIINRVFPYNGGYLALCTDNKTYKTYIEYYDKELKSLKTKYIELDSEFGDIIMRPRDFFYLYNDRLYGTMSHNGKYLDYLIVIDASTSDILHLSKIQNNNSGYRKQHVGFHINDDGKLINIKLFDFILPDYQT